MIVGLMQRVCAGYRVPLFDLLADTLPGGLALYAGDPRPDEMIDQSRRPERAVYSHAQNRHLFHGRFYLCLQTDVLDQMGFVPAIADDLKTMDEAMFHEIWGGLSIEE